MPINLENFSRQLGDYISQTKEQMEEMGRRLQKAEEIFNSFDHQNDALQQKLEKALQTDPDLRSAVPLDEPLSTSKAPLSAALPENIIGADGSQIYTDRHSALAYAMINIAAVSIQPTGSSAPQSTKETWLYPQDFLRGGTISRDHLDLTRDLEERTILGRLAAAASGSTVTLTDGLLELWHGIGQDSSSETHYQLVLEKYKASLATLRDAGAVTAGYIDKPQANYVTRLLEIAKYHEERQGDLRKNPPLGGVSDRFLFEKFLRPGQRSAIFGIHSKSSKDYAGDFSLHFFYINVGTEKFPCISRVDIPQWVASDEEKLSLLHNTLLEQCRIFPTTPFPYCLQRAHEDALIRRTDQEEIEKRMIKAMLDEGINVDWISNKSHLKTLLY